VRRPWELAGTPREAAAAFRDGRRIGVSRITALERALLFHGNLGPGEAGPPPGIAGLIARVERTRGFGDFYQHMLVAEGAGRSRSIRDAAVGRCRPSGYRGGSWGPSHESRRRASIYKGSLVTSNGPLHESALRVLTQEKGVS